MTLAIRLLVAFGSLAVVSTVSVGLIVRNAWRDSENRRFNEQVEGARIGVSLELAAERESVHRLLRPICQHVAFVDQTLIELERGKVSAGQRLALSQLVPEEMKALQLDELVLVTGSGDVLGAGHDRAIVGSKQSAYAKLLQSSDKDFPTLRKGDSQTRAAIVGRCSRASGRARVALVGARHFQPVLERVGRAYGVRIALAGEPGSEPLDDEAVTSFTSAEDDRLEFVIGKSRKHLNETLEALDRILFMTSGAIVVASILLAFLLARSLARPLALLSSEVAQVVQGEPRMVSVQGTREMMRLATAFNMTLTSLAKLRQRHAAMERMAAWREVARRVAHEIKNPLTPIRSSIETLRRLRERDDPKFDTFFDESTKAMLEDVRRIAGIASDFARFARLPSPKPEAVDISEVVRSVAASHGASAAAIDLRIPDGPPVEVDRDQLAQVLVNLMQNAIDASSANSSPRVVVEVAYDCPESYRISVDDNGSGVQAEHVERLFEPYFTTKETGTGLGLSIVQRIVLEHDGQIEYVPLTPGARFVVTLPCAGPALAPASQSNPNL